MNDPPAVTPPAAEGNGHRSGDASVRRTVAVVGASAGGVEALSALVRNLPADLPIPLLVVLHMPATRMSRLADLLDRSGPLPTNWAKNGEIPMGGRIYVAPPDRHMVLSGGRTHLLDGPRENGVRPAADPLFRSAAASLRDQVIGVILSGTLDDGAAGMAAIQAFGGATVVQDPEDALSDGMPRAVLELIEPDFVLPASGIGPVLADLARGPAETRVRRILSGRQALVADPSSLPPLVSDMVCPDCGGSLAEVIVGPISRYRCRVGHVYSPEALFGMKTAELEAGLWAALRSLEESASISKRLAERSRKTGSEAVARRFQQRQDDVAQRADLVRQALESLSELADGELARETVVAAEPEFGEGGRHGGGEQG